MKTTHKHWFALTASTLGLTGLSLASGFGDEKYTYDASGNVLEKQIGDQVTRYDYTGNQLNGSTSDSTRKQYAYDSSGRLTSDSEAGMPTRNMEHQYLDKVTKVQNGDKTTEFFYNAEGQLVATISAGTSETFAWDGLAMVNRGEQLYVNEAHVVGGVPVIVGDEVAVSDVIGTSLSTGTGSFDSTAFGEGLAKGLFTGKPYIQDLSGFAFNYRTYSARDARWTSVDPSGFPDGKNNTIYVNSNPVSFVDPSGLKTETEVVEADITVNGKSIKVVRSYSFDKDTPPDFAGDAALSGKIKDDIAPSNWEWKSAKLIWINTSDWQFENIPGNNAGGRKYFYKDGAAKGEAVLIEDNVSFPSCDIAGMGLLDDLATQEYEY